MDRNDAMMITRVILKDLLQEVDKISVTIFEDRIILWLEGPNIKIQDGQTRRTLSMSLHSFIRRVPLYKPIMAGYHQAARELLQQSLAQSN